MEMFVDSSDWVMAPNVYGMGYGYLVMVEYSLQSHTYVVQVIF